ncbi:MAG: ribulose-phosphate 3-epimerase [Bacilli bacterium]|nr:ribulose-phosphate 3-epimerase [Bacilli bacterium]
MKIHASFLKIQNEKNNVIKLNEVSDGMHYDVMDGIFVENKTIDFSQMQELDKLITKPKDIHLMVKDIYNYVDMYKELNPDYITFHYEATNDINKTIDYIKSFKIKVGLAINPNTAVRSILEYLNKIDLVLVMSVFPGKGGHEFIDISEKINQLNIIRNINKLNYKIEVDGGINDQTINKIKGADIAVIGSFITNSDNYKNQIEKIRGEL